MKCRRGCECNFNSAWAYLISHKSLVSLSFIVLVSFLTPLAHGVSLTRGPYLQVGTSNSILVRWSTDKAVIGEVRYGSNSSALNRRAVEAKATKKHAVTIRGLSPQTKYYYSVNVPGSQLTGNRSEYYFRTAPSRGKSLATRVWVIGDSGYGGKEARSVFDGYRRFAKAKPTNVWLLLGDNAYQTSKGPDYQGAFFDMYPELMRQTVAWPTLGNHDRVDEYLDAFTLPKRAEAGGEPSGTERFYSFDHGRIHFICLDSEGNLSKKGSMYRWLERDLRRTRTGGYDWLIAYWHHPPYTKGSHDSDIKNRRMEIMRRRFVPLLESYGADLILTGHSARYERSMLIKGHYGHSNEFARNVHAVDAGTGNPATGTPYRKPAGLRGGSGTVYNVVGVGSLARGSGHHPVALVEVAKLGSVVLDIDKNRLDSRFIDDRGTVLDTYRIVKGGRESTPPSAVDDAYSTQKGKRLIVPKPGLLGNDDDSDGDRFTAELLAGTQKGSVRLRSDGSFTYTPAAGVVGRDQFTYRALGDDGPSNVATVTIDIGGGAPPPSSGTQTYEAEQAAISRGFRVKRREAGYTGSGYVDYVGEGNVTWTVSVKRTGTYELVFRYALRSGNRPLQILVDDSVTVSSLPLSGTGSWSKWGEARVTARLTAGPHTIRAQSLGSSGPNLDHLRIAGGDELPPTPPVQSRYEAERASRTSRFKAKRSNPGYAGSGYVDYVGEGNVTWSVTVPSTGNYELGFRYALASGNRPLDILVDGSTRSAALPFPGTGSWANWRVVKITTRLNAGVHTIRAQSTGRSGGNLDHLTVVRKN